MQYMGGKSRIARYIAEIINNTLDGGGERSMRYQGGKSRIATPLAQILPPAPPPPPTPAATALLSFSVVAAPLKAKVPAMTALY